MDYRRAIGKMYPTARFFVEETYDSLVWWKDTQKPKKKTYKPITRVAKPNGYL